MLWQNNMGSNICWILLWNYIFWSIPSILVHFEYSLLKDLVNYSVQTGGLGDKHSKTNYAHLWYQHQTPLIFDWLSFHFWYSTKTSNIIHQSCYRKKKTICQPTMKLDKNLKTNVQKKIGSVRVSERKQLSEPNKL